MAKMNRSTNHPIKRVALAEEEVNRSGQEKTFLLQVVLEEQRAEEVRMCNTTKQVNGKPIKGVEKILLLVPELMEAPGGNVAEDEVRQEGIDENQSDLDQLLAYRSSVHDAMGVILANQWLSVSLIFLGT